MGFNLMSEAENAINTDMGNLKNQLPAGKIPEAAAIAELKGTLPNINSIKNILASDTKVPNFLLKDFKEKDLLTTVNIPLPEIEIPKIGVNPKFEFNPSNPKIEPKIDVAKLKKEGLTEEQIAEEERKKEIRQKRNDKAAEIMNKFKSEAAGAMKGIVGGVTGKIDDLQGNLQGTLSNVAGTAATNVIANALGGMGGGCGPNLAAKIAAFSYFKSQFGTIKGRADGIKETIDGLKEKGKDVMKGGTETVTIKGTLEGVEKTLKSSADSLKSSTDSMKPTFPGHPGPGNKANSEVSQKTREARDKAEGFSKNLKQTVSNVGKVLKGIFNTLKNILGTIIKAIGAILQIVSFIAFLKQMAELMMLIFMKNDACANRGGDQSNSAQSAEQFLGDIGYPGFSGEDFSTSINEAINNLNKPTLSPGGRPTPNTNFTNTAGANFPSPTGTKPSDQIDPTTGLPFNSSTLTSGNTLGGYDLFDPIMFGNTQLGTPLTQEDLNPSLSGKTFDNHPILGNLEGIHPQFINELYEDGILPLVDPNNPKALEPDQYAKDLDKLYDEIEDELNETKQIEYIERLYNLKFEMIGYRRYYDRA